MNRVCLVGNLGRDPEIRKTSNGKAVCSFAMATTETIYDTQKKEKKELTEWHNIVVWNKQGENCAKYLKKGSKVAIEGSLKTESYDDKQGVKKWTTKLIANRVEFLNSQKQEYDSTSQQPFPDEGELPPMPDGMYDSIPF